MKIIKFRLRQGNKIVGYEVWNPQFGGWCYAKHQTIGVLVFSKEYIKHDNKDRFAGEHDKNNNGIYEGDLLIVYCQGTKQDNYYEVKDLRSFYEDLDTNDNYLNNAQKKSVVDRVYKRG